MKNNWQIEGIELIKNLFNNIDGVKSLLLVGSLANDLIEIDNCSDIDLKVIVDKEISSKFYESTSWIEKLGNIFSLEIQKGEYSCTFRICLEDFKRFDISFITYEYFLDSGININGKYKILKNNINNLESYIKIENSNYKGIDNLWLLEFQNNFWHKATISIIKLMRNDLIISLHLILDLERDCLVLKMLERDEKLKTNIHRLGGYGNEFIKELLIKDNNYSKKDLLKIIENTCEKFDELSKKLNGIEGKSKFIKEFIKDLNENL